MCWHKWTKWEQYEAKMMRVPEDDLTRKYEYVEHWQKRECKKCGYEQRKEIDNY